MKRWSTWPDEDGNKKVKQRRRVMDIHASTTPVPSRRQSTSSTQRYAEKFVHEPFENSGSQIRLLRMLPNSNANDDHLQYSISTYDFDQVGKFIAISYTWGKSNNKKDILIDNKICSVWQNCHYVLDLVYTHWKLGRIQADLLWVDSVCINQKDDEEKSIQVSFMGEIYAKAAEVLACIGPHADDSKFLVKKAREVAEFRHDCTHNEGFMCQDCRLPWEEWVRDLGVKRLTRLCMSCQTFGRRVYWTRIWIIQEVAKATSLRILCGTDILPWMPIRNLEDFLAMEMDEIESLFTTSKRLPTCEVNSMHDVFRAKKGSIQIKEVFSQFSDSLCSEPRDRLYGLLGLIDWSNHGKPVFPDYKASIFDVAVQVAPYFSLEQIPEMLAAFRLTSKDETVQRLIGQRRQVIDFGERNITGDAVTNSKPFYDDHSVNGSSPAMCAYLESDEADNMTATLTEVNESDYDLERRSLDFEESGDSWAEGTSSSEESERSASDMASLLSSTSPGTRAQPIMLRSEVVGYVCNRARKGDILVQLSTLSRCILLMRQNHGEIFDVVGQGMLLREYDFGCDTGVYDDSAEVALFTAQIELKIAAEDVMLLFAMNIDDGSRSYNLKDCWNQAVTSVTGTSLGAARITERTQMLAKDVAMKRDKSIPPWAKVLQSHSRTVRADFPTQYDGWIEGSIDDLPEELQSSAET